MSKAKLVYRDILRMPGYQWATAFQENGHWRLTVRAVGQEFVAEDADIEKVLKKVRSKIKNRVLKYQRVCNYESNWTYQRPLGGEYKSARLRKLTLTGGNHET